MKRLEDCEACQKRLTMLVLGFALVGLLTTTKTIYKGIKKLTKKEKDNERFI